MTVSVRNFYDRSADPDLFAQNLIPPYCMDYAIYLLEGREVRFVLDVGCGSGGVVLWAAEQNPQTIFTGLDLSHAVLKKLRKEGSGLEGRNLHLVQGNIEEDIPELAGIQFDLIILSRVLHELADPVKTLGRLRTMLAPGGLLYVSVPSAYGVQPFRDLNPVMERLKVGDDWEDLIQLWTDLLIALPQNHPVHRSRLFHLLLQGDNRYFTPTLFYLLPPFSVRSFTWPALLADVRASGLHVADIPNRFELEPEFQFTQRGVLDEWGEHPWYERMEMGELLSADAPMLELFLSPEIVQNPIPEFDPEVPLVITPLCHLEFSGSIQKREARFEFYNGLGGRFEGLQANWLERIGNSPARSANEWRRRGEDGWFRFVNNLFERGILIPHTMKAFGGEKS